jgi:hypothetical protein
MFNLAFHTSEPRQGLQRYAGSGTVGYGVERHRAIWRDVESSRLATTAGVGREDPGPETKDR